MLDTHPHDQREVSNSSLHGSKSQGKLKEPAKIIMDSRNCEQNPESISMKYYSDDRVADLNYFLSSLHNRVFFKVFCLISLVLCSIWLVSCTPPPKIIKSKKAISLQETVRIAVLPPKNLSNLQKMENWPTDSTQSSKLMGLFHGINQELIDRIGNFSRLNRTKIVHQSQNPHYRVQIEFKNAKLLDSKCTIPFLIGIHHQSDENQDFEIAQDHSGSLKFNDKESGAYYFWGDILQDYRASFPYAKILENLFILPE